MARSGGFVGRVLEEVEDRLGYAVVDGDRLNALEEAAEDRRTLQRNLDLLAYTALDYATGRSQDLTPEARRTLAQRARVVWMRDPMAGAAVDLMNDFVFGKGIPRPKAKDPEVQKIIDEAWTDPDNERILTSHAALLALGTDLSLQSNLFLLVFNDGADGKVKLSMLEHDAVRSIVKDPNDRFCPLWYVAEVRKEEWDFQAHGPKIPMKTAGTPDVLYYEHWQNFQERKETAKNAAQGQVEPPPEPPAKLVGDGLVYHVAENKTTEMAFGHPRMDRTLRWFSAYNSFMEARVDMMKAAAALVMKRKVKGTPNQLARAATQALSRRPDLAIDGPAMQAGPTTASIINENDSVTHEAFKLDSGAANAAQDASQLRSQISAATRWSPPYYGDLTSGNLSTATSLELPILKGVETRQEMFEGIIRFFVDRVIEAAVEKGRLKEQLTPEEIAAKRKDEGTGEVPTSPDGLEDEGQTTGAQLALVAAHEDKAVDEESTQRDLGYEFSMPNPLRRALGDIVTAIMNVAQTFDPNNTNVELSRALLLISLEEMEVQDAAELVEKIFPPGYVDPAIAAAQAAGQPAPTGEYGPQQPQPDQFGDFGPGATGADGQQHGANNPYGAPMQGSTPESFAASQQALWSIDAAGKPIPTPLLEAIWARRPAEVESIAASAAGRDDLVALLGPTVDSVLAELGNGNGNGH